MSEIVPEERATKGVHVPARTVGATIMGKSVTLDVSNTAVYEFYEPFKDLSHVFINNHPEVRDGSATWVFDSQALLDACKEARFTVTTGFPCETDIEVYSRVQGDKVDEEWPTVAYGVEG